MNGWLSGLEAGLDALHASAAWRFAGKLHPLVVHFPIALLLSAAFLEAVSWIRRKPSASGVSPTLFSLGAIGALVSAPFGWALAETTSDPPAWPPATAQDWHGWLGITTAIGAVALTALSFWARRRPSSRVLTVYRCAAVILASLVFTTGHLGGRVAYGPNYFSQAPKTDTAPSSSQAASTPASSAVPIASPQANVDFASDIEPIFREHCIKCHGPEKQKKGLRLDGATAAMLGGDDGPVILPGKSAESPLIQRLTATDPKKRMPPVAEGPALPPARIAKLASWIDQGAPWRESSTAVAPRVESTHWAFQAPVRPEPPRVRHTDWPRNPIDAFVAAGLERQGFEPSPEADRATLIRRLSLDLVGLPPSPEEVDEFVSDARPDAYERLVDRLLASPRYGEKWARHWLDAARYADTNGYEKDLPRSIWPYRDWVIQALNADMPFDRFTVEQIAGDMLPNATLADKVATGFHRNTMINEEGGIDVEEFRYEAVVDRVKTTATVWLGLTLGCAQCHSHKYDPITQREYWQFFAFLDDADDVTIDVPNAETASHRGQVLADADEKERGLAAEFPPYEDIRTWEVLEPKAMSAEQGSALASQPDGSILVSGEPPERELYTIQAESGLDGIDTLRLEVLTDPSLPNTGPGWGEDGNFVLTELRLAAAPRAGTDTPVAVKIATAETDSEHVFLKIKKTLDARTHTGWALDDRTGFLNKDRVAYFRLAEPLGKPGGSRLTIELEQHYGEHRNLGRFRLSAGRLQRTYPFARLPSDEQRRANLDRAYRSWLEDVTPRAVRWTPLEPSHLRSRNGATLTLLEDQSVLVSGDRPNTDVTDFDLVTDLVGITALRIEALPHQSLPQGGPGRGLAHSPGNFLLSEIAATVAPRDDPDAPPTPLTFTHATESYAQRGHPASLALDGKADTGWAIEGRTGEPHAAVFELAADAGLPRGSRFHVTLSQLFVHQETLGRFRVSVTTEPRPVRASGVPADVEVILEIPERERTEEQRAALFDHFLSVAPELAEQRAAIAALRASVANPTTLVVEERREPRVTRIHERGEFVRPGELVSPAVPAVLPPLPDDAPANRLTLARWLVDPRNPLTARVAVNRLWQTYFGRGLVATPDDFGTQGQPPSHPELLDWLATELVRQHWDLKAMHRLIVESATYRQSSRVTRELLERDPENVWLARGARFRLDAELVRDVALAASGLLSGKIGGPSVFPPQPEGVAELSYGSPAWIESQGEDRFRRGLYTFWKRTSPYPAATAFDAPNADTTCVRRSRSNSPLAALTSLNDPVFVEAARALAERAVREAPSDERARAERVFRLCLARPPAPDEVDRIVAFYGAELARFRDGSADAKAVLATSEGGLAAARADGGKVPSPTLEPEELAAWMLVARAVLNLDETLSKG